MLRSLWRPQVIEDVVSGLVREGKKMPNPDMGLTLREICVQAAQTAPPAPGSLPSTEAHPGLVHVRRRNSAEKRGGSSRRLG